MLNQPGIAHLIPILKWVLLLGIGFPAVVQAAALELEFHNDRIRLHADEVSLISVLKAIAEKADITITSDDPLTRPVTLILDDVSVEESIRRLLAEKSHVLVYKKTEQGDSVITEIRVLDPVTNKISIVASEPEPVEQAPAVAYVEPPPQPFQPFLPEEFENPMKSFEKSWFRHEIENIDLVSEEISAEAPKKPVSKRDESDDDDETDDLPGVRSTLVGMRITQVAVSSVFARIGLKNGDVIRNVNGKQVTTTGEFIRALQDASQQQSMIRIERIRAENEMMMPIYINLSTPDAPQTLTDAEEG